MPAPPRLAGLASSSAFTSFRVRPTTSKKRSRSASAPRAPAWPERRPQFFQQPFVPDHHQRLPRRLEQVEELTAIGPRVDVLTIRQQLYFASAASGFEQPRAELVTQNPDELVQLVNR